MSEESRDHREIAKILDLFHLQEEAAGSVFWHPNGYALYKVIEDYMRTRFKSEGYKEIKTPQLLNKSLWEKSGHWEHFSKNMFLAEGGDERSFAIKPMNCPGHVLIFNSKLRSYRDLPLRLNEFGICHRAEPSGALHGIMRVRQFTQDDAHIFCTREQILEETSEFIRFALSTYKDFGFEDIKIGLSTRPESRAGSDDIWDKAEKDLEMAIATCGLEYEIYPGEGAFYGPKLEFALKDSHGREWQCGTLQLDFVLAERLGASYIAEDGKKHPPVILHRAIFGSMERFIGILLEHYGTELPNWLAPVQVAVISIKPSSVSSAESITYKMESVGLRVVTDFSDDNVSEKIKKFSESKIPFIVAIGPRDIENDTIAIRRLGDQKALIEPRNRVIHDIQAECIQPGKLFK